MLRRVLAAVKPSYLETSSCRRPMQAVSRVCLYFFQSSSSLPISKKVDQAEKITLKIYLYSDSTITSCAMMGKLLNLSVPQFPHL